MTKPDFSKLHSVEYVEDAHGHTLVSYGYGNLTKHIHCHSKEEAITIKALLSKDARDTFETIIQEAELRGSERVPWDRIYEAARRVMKGEAR